MMSKCLTTAGLIVAILALIGASGFGADSQAQPNRPAVKRIRARNVPMTREFREGEVLVKYKESVIKTTVPSKRAQVIRELGDRLHTEFGVTVVSTSPTFAIQRLKVAPGETVESTINKLKQDSAVDLVEPNYRASVATPQPPPPNDPEWLSGELWGMVKIGMKQGWRSAPQSGNIVVAVIDTGIDYGHGDLITNIWRNNLEASGTLNSDDDSNGIVDDIYGANFCNRTAQGDPLGNPVDDNGHGTLVAGTIAAVGNNGLHVAGVNWTAKLMALKSFCSDGTASVADIIDAIQYAVAKGANIINASWTISGNSGNLKSAIINAPNILFVAAAGNSAGGNDNDANPVYPASYTLDNVMAVAATTEQDQLWSDSHWGKTSVHIAAPGEYILSTFLSNDIAYGEGTSMAAPHTAGCAALVQAQRSASTLLSPKDLKAAIMSAGDQPPGLAQKIVDGRRLNCDKAIRPTDNSPPSSPTNLRLQ